MNLPLVMELYFNKEQSYWLLTLISLQRLWSVKFNEY
jgi:hypothetical protein